MPVEHSASAARAALNDCPPNGRRRGHTLRTLSVASRCSTAACFVRLVPPADDTPCRPMIRIECPQTRPAVGATTCKPRPRLGPIANSLSLLTKPYVRCQGNSARRLRRMRCRARPGLMTAPRQPREEARARVDDLADSRPGTPPPASLTKTLCSQQGPLNTGLNCEARLQRLPREGGAHQLASSVPTHCWTPR